MVTLSPLAGALLVELHQKRGRLTKAERTVFAKENFRKIALTLFWRKLECWKEGRSIVIKAKSLPSTDEAAASGELVEAGLARWQNEDLVLILG